MAILNFTNSAVRSVFSFFGFSSHHENISCSHQQLTLSFENLSALQMLNKTFCFRYKDDQKNRLFPLGSFAVVSVVLNVDSGPEVGLFSDSSRFVDMIPLANLVVQHEVIKTS